MLIGSLYHLICEWALFLNRIVQELILKQNSHWKSKQSWIFVWIRRSAKQRKLVEKFSKQNSQLQCKQSANWREYERSQNRKIVEELFWKTFLICSVVDMDFKFRFSNAPFHFLYKHFLLFTFANVPGHFFHVCQLQSKFANEPYYLLHVYHFQYTFSNVSYRSLHMYAWDLHLRM